MIIRAGTPLGAKTKVFDVNGVLVSNANWLDTETGIISLIDFNINGNAGDLEWIECTIYNQDTELSYIEKRQVRRETFQGVGYTYQLDNGPRIQLTKEE